MITRLTLLLCLLLYGAGSMAQAVLTPLQQETRQPDKTTAGAAMRLLNNPLPLPFFDDFSTVSVSPDPNRWINGGVFINNRYGLRPITKNVASFDGLNAKGRPYNPGAVSPGPVDTLTSQPILLGNLTPADSVYLSFFWQSGGLGDVPDRTTNNSIFLQVDFKDATGAWQTVWRQQSTGSVTDFAQVFVGLRDTRYFHNNFQFRFRSVGNQSSMLDVWNVDYVELNRNRRKGQNTTRDIGISRTASKLLKHYTAMPLRHFLEAPAEELSEEVNATMNNLGDFPGAISWRGYIKKAGATVADTFLVAQGLVPSIARQYEIAGTPRITNLALPGEHFTLVHGFRLDTRETNPLQRANDTTSRKTEFADYFAYDDGTAEAGFSNIATGTTQTAQRFDLNRPDEVRGFRVYFPRVGNGLANTSITFRIWADEAGKPGAQLHQEAFQIQYSDNLNEFYEVILPRPIRVSESFYIGWSQPGQLFVNIGFDRNETAAGRRFLWSTLSGWQEDTVIEGAIMMRPLMTGSALGIKKETALEAAIKLYPNPSAGQVIVQGDYRLVQVYDVTGKLVHTHKYSAGNELINLKHLANGLYTLRIETDRTIVTRKLILARQ